LKAQIKGKKTRDMSRVKGAPCKLEIIILVVLMNVRKEKKNTSKYK